jgi:hypothetical protein
MSWGASAGGGLRTCCADGSFWSFPEQFVKERAFGEKEQCEGVLIDQQAIVVANGLH